MMMITPTAATKPVITGSERKRTRNPRRVTPRAMWIPPTSRASVAASTTYCGLAVGASFASATAAMIEMVARGPTLSWGDDPRSAYTSTGTTDA